jgi:hypothetical protein
MSVIFIHEAHELAHNSGRRPLPKIKLDIPVKKQKRLLESLQSVHFILIRTPKPTSHFIIMRVRHIVVNQCRKVLSRCQVVFNGLRSVKGFVKAGQLAQNLQSVNAKRVVVLDGYCRDIFCAKRDIHKDTYLHTNRKHDVFISIILAPNRQVGKCG